MFSLLARGRRLVAALLLLCTLALSAVGCGGLPFDERPASGYVYGSHAPLRVAVIDATTTDGWSPAIEASVATYSAGSPYLAFQHDAAAANIVVTIRDYRDSAPPALEGYRFPFNAGGFAAVYDAAGAVCNFPPSPLPENCSGEIARADVYLNNIIPAGSDIEARRERLILHELGHAFGLTRHSPDLDIAQLELRYGWGMTP